MDVASARDSIVRKFTNYRSNRKKPDASLEQEMIDALKTAATALVDFKTYSKGKNLFKRRMSSEIMARRDEIIQANSDIPLIAAYQKALKQLWAECDQDYWEAQAVGEADDIYE